MIIKLNEDGSNLATIVKEINGRKKEKIITVDDLIASIIASNRMGSFEKVISPLYRQVMNSTLIQSINYAKNSSIYIIHRKKCQAPVQIFSRFYGDVGFPGLLFAIDVVNNKLIKLYVVAVKDDDIKEDTKIYRYPFTNVSGKTGSVCLGSNHFEKGILEGDKLFNVINQFFSMPNTLHSYSPHNNTRKYEFEKMIRLLTNKEFDDQLLVENTDLKTYIEWIEKL
ncbi:MAG: hypothetical protein E7E64_05105 [Clostridium celatum]|uniref:hypothetical protein n=1 Tax=Clostridium tertium TaxID=1559 RepID=UPI0029036B5A|nr:hypothetical protein [Clostridium celatum]